MSAPLLRCVPRLAVCLLALAARTAAAQSAPPPPLNAGPVTIGGFVQLDYLAAIEAEAPNRTTESPSTFAIPRTRLEIRGALGPRVQWTLTGDFASLPDDKVLRDASVTVNVAPAASVRIGQYTIPYSLERITSSSRLEVIDRSVLGTSMTPSRDVGVTVFNPTALWGWLSYSASVINGAGQNRLDNNDAKDLVGRVTVRVPRAKGLSVGVNGTRGEEPAGERRRFGGDVAYEHGQLRVAVEALSQSLESGTTHAATGYYILGVWHHPAPTITPYYAGYELAARWVDVDDDDTRLTSHTLQFGGNYYVTPQVRVMNNLVVPVGDDQPRPRTRWWSRVQVLF